MKIYVYLDESGSIHKNSKTKYFAVGGYWAFQEYKIKIISKYKKINKEIKDNNNYELDKEIKSYEMSDLEKVAIFNNIQNISGFYGCVKIFEKKSMKKEIIESNIFFNYAIKILFKDCIVPLLILKYNDINIEFIVSVDNRNVRIGDLNNLETYLKTEFCLENYNFKITYYDSATNFGIQLADLITNTFYNFYKDYNIVRNIFPILRNDKFKISLFPGYKKNDRFSQIEYNKN